MVDIGGDSGKGKNSKMNAWRIGINKPVDDSLSVSQELQTVLAISDVGMSIRNYRNFTYYKVERNMHTMNPRTDTQLRIASCHHCHCKELRQCRCARYCFHGDGTGLSQSFCGNTS